MTSRLYFTLGNPMGEIFGFSPGIVERIQYLLTNRGPARGPLATYAAMTGQFAEAQGANVPLFTHSKPSPLLLSTTVQTGIQSLLPYYDKMKKAVILPIPDSLAIDGRRILDEPVQKYLLSENPNFSKFLASIDPKVKGQLAGRFVAALFTKLPEAERALIGRLPFSPAVRDTMLLNFVFHLYPGVADVAADQLAEQYYEMFWPVVNQLSPENVRSAVESYVDMFHISGKDRELAVSQILRSPKRTTLAVVIGRGGYSIDSLKDFLARNTSNEQIRKIISNLLLGEGPEGIRDLYIKLQEGRQLIGQLHTLPKIRVQPSINEAGRPISTHILTLVNKYVLPEIEHLTNSPNEPGKLEIIHGELAASVDYINRLTKGLSRLSAEELDRVNDVVEHLYKKFGRNLPGVSMQTPDSVILHGRHSHVSKQLFIRSDITTFFHELAHGINDSALGRLTIGYYPIAIANEISANAFAIAATAYVKGIKHPLTDSAIEAGLLPGGSDTALVPLDWVTEYVLPSIERTGIELSALGGHYINIYRKQCAPYLGSARSPRNITSRQVRNWVRPFSPIIDAIGAEDIASSYINAAKLLYESVKGTSKKILTPESKK